MKKTYKNILLRTVATMAMLPTFAQNPVPAKPQSKAITLVGGIAHLGNGQVIQNSMIGFENGKITLVADATTIRIDRSKTDIIDVSGKHIYPGLISPANRVGLSEIESVPASIDFLETGQFNPNIRALVAYNCDSEIIPTVRTNGILVSQATPEGGMVSGQSAIMEMDGWNWGDAALKADDGVWLNWVPFLSREFNPDTFTFNTVKNTKRLPALQELDKSFNDALAYSEGKGSTTNLKMEAMTGLFDGSKTLYVRTEVAKEMIEAIQFAKAHKVKKVVIVGGGEAPMVMDFLKENNVAVIIGSVHDLPNRVDESVYAPYELPAILHKNGVLCAISYAGLSWRTRNLPYLAGTAAAFGGIDKEEALKLITSNTAKILGIDDKVGTLEIGKHATLIVSKGDVLDMASSQVEISFIQGKRIDLDDKQKRLYLKFSERYTK
jgi:imidazolonepropionase-like amidohydrolase